MKNVIGTMSLVAVGLGITYGIYFIGKIISYTVFYESMDLDSITEAVKASCIK